MGKGSQNLPKSLHSLSQLRFAGRWIPKPPTAPRCPSHSRDNCAICPPASQQLFGINPSHSNPLSTGQWAGTAFPLGKRVYFASWGVSSPEYPCASLFFTLLWFGRGILRTIHGWEFLGSIHSHLHPKSGIGVKILPGIWCQNPKFPPAQLCSSQESFPPPSQAQA